MALTSKSRVGPTTLGMNAPTRFEDRRDVAPSHPSPDMRRRRPRSEIVVVQVLNGFRVLHHGQSVALPASSQRVVAFLAVKARPLRRSYVAGTLWAESEEEHAAANLRSALWRLRRLRWQLVESVGTELWLGSTVRVDLDAALQYAHRATRWGSRGLKPREADSAFELLASDLLPEWCDEWVTIERESFRQLRLHALEGICERFTAAGMLEAAVRAGLAAVEGEPMRESAHRILMKVYAAENNSSEVIRQYRLYRRMLEDELGVEPSVEMKDLVRGLFRDGLVNRSGAAIRNQFVDGWRARRDPTDQREGP